MRLEHAVSLERLIAYETDRAFKEQLLSQAAAFRTLAAEQTEEYGSAASSPSENSA
jgi:hypothetical protein